MDFLDKRILGICKEFKKLSIKQSIPITDWKYKKGKFLYPEEAMDEVESFSPFNSEAMHWYGPDEHYWFYTDFTVPHEMNGKPLWIHVKTQIEEWDDAKNPQFLLFVNGTVTQGIDMNHREVLLSRNAKEGDNYHLDLQAYTGILHNEFSLFVDIWEIDEEIKGLYYDMFVPLSAFNRMEKDDSARIKIERTLNKAVNILDLRTPYSEDFYTSVREARSYLEKALYTDMAGKKDIIATCIGHTHIDVAWWWTVEQTREKVVRSFSTVLKLMDEYPNYKFMSSQPQLYAFLKQRYPDLYKRLKQRVAEKRWEPEGGMWVEADCNLTSGESLVRQFIHGKRFFKEEFGVDNRILWLPDVFGYSGALPQIMKKCGIDYFMTTKLAWNQFNKMPHDTFMWRGIDGTEVLTHLITTIGVGQDEKDFFTTYNGMLHPDAIIGGWHRYQDKEINNDILVSYGYGDGGGGPTREMLENSLRMEKGMDGIPTVRQEFARTYFDELQERVKDNKRLAVWEGELYFEYHRGTYTSMARNKRSNRKSELHMMDLELLSILAKEMCPYPSAELDKLWKMMLINQFHDILPGTSIHEVYEVTKKEYKEIESKIEELTQKRLDVLTKKGEGVTVFNTVGFMRNDVIHLGCCKADALVDGDGTVFSIQQTKDGAVAYLTNLPPKGYQTFRCVNECKKDIPFALVNNNLLETPFYTVEIDKNGLFTRLFDKTCKREVLKENSQANLFRMYEDKPIYYDNWDIDIFYTEKYWDADSVVNMEWTELGTVRATLEIERRISNSVIKQKIHFYANSQRIDFDTYVDWKEHQHLLKVLFPVNVHTDEATFDIQFGNVTRKVHSNTSWDRARFESCGQKWIDFSEGHYGVSLLNDCKYGHSIKDGVLALTLIKSGIEPNPTTDQEEHYFSYALYPHKENWRNAGTIEEAYKFNQPAITVHGGVPGDSYSLASINASNVMIETIKQSEDGLGTIVRVYETDNALTQAKLVWNKPFSCVEECNLIEEKIAEIKADENTIPFIIKPYEIKTFYIHD